MQNLTALFLLFVFLILAGCQKPASPPLIPAQPLDNSKKLLLLKIDTSYHTNQSDNWVMIHDINGKLLEYKSFETGNTIDLKTTKEIPDNKVHITFFEYNGSISSNALSTYLLNIIGQEWTLRKENPAYPFVARSKIGDFSASVSNVADGSAFLLSNKNGAAIGGDSWSGGSNILTMKYDIYNDSQDYSFFLSNNLGIPKYKFFRNVKDKDVYSISANGMDNFDKNINITFPQTSINNIFYLIEGWEAGQSTNQSGWIVNSSFNNNYIGSSNVRNNITLGYLNSIPTYRTTLNVSTNTYNYYYGKFGTRPDNISLPLNAAFTINDKSLSNFQYQNNQPFTIRTSRWRLPLGTGISIDWIVRGPEGSQKISELPVEFASKYPILSLSSPQYFSSDFITQGQLYSDLIDVTYKGKIKSETYEIYSIGVR